MKVSNNFFKILEEFEAFKSCPYNDHIGVATIGIGSTTYPSGIKVSLKDKCIIKEQALDLVRWFIKSEEDKLTSLGPLTQNQFDALMSLIYNIGKGAFASSTIRKKVAANPNDPAIKAEFMKWVKAGGKISNGLVRRRNLEADLYFKK